MNMIYYKKLMKFRLIVPIGILILLLYFSGSIKGFYHRTFHTPKVISNKDFIYLNYSLFPDKKKQEFYDAYKSRQSFYGVMREKGTFEASVVTIYLMTEAGNLTMIIDYTHDPWGIRKFVKKEPKTVILGSCNAEGKFVEKTNDFCLQDIILEVELASGEKIWL